MRERERERERVNYMRKAISVTRSAREHTII